MADAEEDGMDLETLQAQIDMSMAFTHDLVSGWMKASKAKLPSSSRANDDRELEEYMRRPPRLGVGASAPESTGVLSRETAKLRHKLVGNSKKRAREEDDTAGPAASRPTVISDDEDEDSRARAITKKARVDPFAPKSKGPKKPKADPLHALASAPTSTSPAKKAAGATSPAVFPPPAPAHSQDAASSSKSQDGAAEDCEGPSLSTPKKRRKKKKHNHSVRAQGPEETEEGGPQLIAAAPRELQRAAAPAPGNGISAMNGTEVAVAVAAASASASSGAGAPVRGSSPPGSTRGGSVSVGAKVLSSEYAPSTAGSTGVRPQLAPATPARPSSAVLQASSPQRLDPFGMPLLNLSGPPPAADEGHAASPKKKRKKKKKKKKKADVAANPAGPDVDGDGEDDEDEDDG